MFASKGTFAWIRSICTWLTRPVAPGKRLRNRRALQIDLLEDRLNPAPIPFMLADINAVGVGSNPENLTVIGSTLFFSATNTTNGTELWKSDGTTAGTVLVKDIRNGSTGSGPKYLTNVNGTLYFRANDGTNGFELWKSDGTTVGTVLVKDINTGVDSSSPRILTNVNGTLYFSAYDNTNQFELWKSDGTTAGTVLVKDIRNLSSSYPRYLTNLNGTLYFRATDGTNDTELWKSDGTTAGTVLVKDIKNGSGSSYPRYITNVNGTLYFQATDGATGYELWKSDGTSVGTVLVKDIRNGINNSYPRALTNVNGTLYFQATDGANGFELWKSDGTTASTVLVKDINIGVGSSSPSALTNVNGTLYFQATDGATGYELWKSDGTSVGTVLVKDIRNGINNSYPRALTNVNGTLYFRAIDATKGYELWESDGTSVGTVLVKDINVVGHSNPLNLTNVNGTLYFSADDGTNGTELWKLPQAPGLAWSAPASITYGTALSATQLNATAAVPGTFSYSPALGSVLNAGLGQTISVTFTPTDLANYGIDTITVGLNVLKATPTLTVNNSPVTYNGSVQTATVASSVPGTVSSILVGGAANKTNAGTYATTASFVPTDSLNYNSLTTVAAGNFVIGKATPTATLAVSNSPVTYNASARTATVTVSASSVPGTVSTILVGGAANQTNAGTYATTATFVPTDSANYNSLTTVAAGNFVISKATPTLTVNNSPVTYNESVQTATVASSVPGTVSTILVGGAANQTNAGTYATTATFVPTDSVNYNSLTTVAAGNFVIDKATPTATLAVSNSPVTYNASAQSATVTVSASSVPGTVSSILVDGAANQTNAGTYATTATFVPTDSANYNSLITVAAGNFVIGKATPTATLAVSNSPVTYNAAAQSATVTVSASSVPGTVSTILVGTAANQTNAGTYTTTATFVPTDSANYNSLTTVAAGNFVIDKATPTATLAVSNSPVTYNAAAQSATVTVSASSVPGTVSSILVDGAANQTNAGTYATTATFVPTDSANYNSLITVAAGNFVIGKATPTATLAVSNSPVTYNASAQSATVTVSASSVPGTVSTILVGTAANQTNAGTYTTTATFVPTDSANYNSLTTVAAGNFVIDKATPTATLTVSNSPVTYNASAQSATVTVSASSVPGTVSSILVGGLANQTNAGTYATTATFVPTDSANYNSLTTVAAGNFVIGKATPTATLAVSNSPVTYNATAQSATVTVSASSVPGTVSTILVGGLANQTNAGTYATTATFVPTDSANYNSLTTVAAGNFVISKATPTATLTVSNSPVTYNASARTATVTVSASSVPGTVSTILVGTAANQTNAGTYATTATFVPTDSANYNSLTTVAAGNFVISKMTPTATLAVSNSPVTYNASARTATVTVSASSVPGTVSTILVGTAANQTNAGTYATTATFVPTDSANYNSLTTVAAGNFVIDKANQTITWATPASILQGAALQATQLNATVDGVSGGSAAGALTYTPAAGTVLAVGTHTLSVSAAATSNYLAASRTVQIVVTSTTVAPSVTWQLLPGQVNSFGNTNLRNLTYVATYSAGRSTPQKTDFNVMGGTISSIIPIAGTNRTVFNVIISVVLQGNVPAQMTSFVRAGWNAIGSTVSGTASAPVTINSLKRNIPSPLLASPTKPAGSLLGNSDAAIFNMVATFASPVDPATVTPNAFGTTNGTVQNIRIAPDGLTVTFDLDITNSGSPWEGSVRVRIPDNTITDRYGNYFSHSRTISWMYDGIPPTVTLASSVISGKITRPVNITVNFSERIQSLTSSMVEATLNGVPVAIAISGSKNSWRIRSVPGVAGTLVIRIKTGITGPTDLTGNNVATSLPLSITIV